MDYKERLNEASNAINAILEKIREREKEAIEEIKRILKPCGKGGCLIGSEDYTDDIFYVYAEPEANQFDRVLAIRYFNNKLEVLLDNTNQWMEFSRARVVDFHLLIDEIVLNLEYSDGYQPDEDEFRYLIDEDGSKYNPETSFLSGGMDTRCDFNEEALFAYKTRKTLPLITAYLIDKGWVRTHENTYIEFRKGNTSVFFDDWCEELDMYRCFGTEYKPLEDEKPEEDEEKPLMRYAVPYLRSQWTDVYVDATSPEEAIEKADAVFREGKDGWLEWEDVDIPELDKERGVKALNEVL